MTRTRRFACTVLSAAAVMAMAGASLGGTSYVATTVPPLPGGTDTFGYGVNDGGVVVGQAYDSIGVSNAFVFQNGITTALPFLQDGTDAIAWSVSNNNVIVGECRNVNGVSRPVRWDLLNGTWQVTDLGTLEVNNGGFGVATRVNDAGVIVGYSTASIPGGYHATRWSGGNKNDLGTLGFSGNLAYSQALGLNELGEVTGYAYAVLQGPEHGMLVTDRGGIDITPMEQFGLAQWHNVNASGILGGYISSPMMTSSAFRPATFDRTSGDNNGYTLVPLISGLTEGYGYDIADDGTLVGVMFMLDADPALSVFKGFASSGGTTTDLNTVATGLPGVFTEARDISHNGRIVGTAELETSFAAVLLVPIDPCPADFNIDGSITVQDIFDFLAAYFSGDARADFNGDRSTSVQDIFDFLAAYFTGCV
jgi:probable HAF family extracellular repeat protein